MSTLSFGKGGDAFDKTVACIATGMKLPAVQADLITRNSRAGIGDEKRKGISLGWSLLSTVQSESIASLSA